MTKTIKLTAYECGMLNAQLSMTIAEEKRQLEKMKEDNAFEDDIATVENVIATFRAIIDKVTKAEYKD